MTPRRNILLVDDDAGVRDAMSAFLSRAGYAVTVAEDGEKGLRLLESSAFDLVVSDLKMPGMSGMDFLKSIRSRGNNVPFVLLTAYGSIETAVASMKSGARDFLLKPFPPAQLERVIRGCFEAPPEPQPAEWEGGPGTPRIVARSRAMREVLTLARQIGASRATVLITGESGTGKEVLARCIHAHGNGEGSPFVAVNCAAIPEGLLESELFGHERGAFTGAQARRVGKFEQADGGTLLLDEIGEMDLRLQAKLLRVLQERSFERVGGTAPVRVRLRVIATTNRNLREAVRQGTFREDLFFRLNVVPLSIPPLRERAEDILPLAEHFAAMFCAEYGHPAPQVTEEARQLLLRLPYRGNVRELMNRVERAVLIRPGGPIGPSLLAEPEEAPPPPVQEAQCAAGSVREMEKSLILSTLSRTAGNRNRTAAALGISVRTLRNKLNEYRRTGEVIP
ncbi:MAG: sigma-54-dependent Fis family transcriptional regulator [Deltaproteobacteria bacterium]|nr:sigma-54-dependent Fis family transcriptional regulator [Deltaproteobacteria bacterium]